MINKELVNIRQLAILVIFLSIGDAIIILPPSLAMIAKQDAWISVVLSLVFGLFVVYLLTTVAGLYPKLTLVDSSKKILGNWLGTVFSLLFIGYFFIATSVFLRELGDFITTTILPQTPIEAVMLLFVSIIIFGIRLGVETIARAAELLIPFFFIIFLVLMLSSTTNIELTNLQPILEHGMKPIINGALLATAYIFMDLLALLMIIPSIKEHKKVKRGFFIGSLLGGIIIFGTVLISILVQGHLLTASQLYSTYSIAQKINIGDFFQRIEAILAILWMMTLYFKTTLYLYAVHIGLAQTLKLKDYSSLSFPIGFILIGFAMIISPNISYLNNFIQRYWFLFDSTFYILLLLLLGIHLIRKAGKNETCQKLSK